MEVDHEVTLLVRQARISHQRPGPRVIDGRMTGGMLADLRIAGGRIVAVEPALPRTAGETMFDAGGRTVIPGLHDHHLHLRSLLASNRSVQVGPDHVSGPGDMARALRSTSADAHGWRRAVGYHESVAGDLDREVLDDMVPDAPVRVQHRSGVMWVLNSSALELLGVAQASESGIERDAAGRPTGRLFRLDAWLAERVPRDPGLADVAATSARLASLGVTGITDATPGASEADHRDVAAAIEGGTLLQRVHLMCPAGVRPPDHPLISRGPEKYLLDDDRLPPLDDFADSIARAHQAGVAVAVHCVTATQLVFTATVLEAVGSIPGDRIEHAAVVPAGMLGPLASLRATVVINPSLLRERGDTYLSDVDRREQPDLLRGASLLAAGVAVAGGTDAPYGSCDPWPAIATAHSRRTRRGALLGPDEALDETRSLALFTGHPHDPARSRCIVVGEPGDLCILDGDALPHPVGDGRVAATIVSGRLVHRLV